MGEVKNVLGQSDCRKLEGTIFQVRINISSWFLAYRYRFKKHKRRLLNFWFCMGENALGQSDSKINQLYLKSNLINQRYSLLIDIDWRKVKSDLKSWSWMAVKNTRGQSDCRILLRILFSRKMRSISLIFCMLIQIQGRLIVV